MSCTVYMYYQYITAMIIIYRYNIITLLCGVIVYMFKLYIHNVVFVITETAYELVIIYSIDRDVKE